MVIGSLLAILALVFGRKRMKKQVNVPQEISSRFSADHPNAQNLEWHAIKNDTLFEASFSEDGSVKGILFDKEWNEL